MRTRLQCMLEKSTLTSQERKKEIDFSAIFNEKLESITPLSEQESKRESGKFQSIGIKKIIRKCPAIIFVNFFGDKKQLWITDSLKTDNDHPHTKVKKELKDFLEINKLNQENKLRVLSSAYVVQDDENKLYLFFDGFPTETIERDINEYGFNYIKKYEELMQSYGIKKMIGLLPETTNKGDYANGRNVENILDKDIIGKMREDESLVSYAKKYKMTNNQFMRFRIRAIAIREAVLKNKGTIDGGKKYLINLDDLAQEIIIQDKE